MELKGGDAVSHAIEITSLEPAELTALIDLLRGCGLPVEGVEEHVASALAARRAGRLVGSAVLELYGTDALLRSVAVERELRGQGLGARLTEAALSLARERGVRRVFLLTETAAQFFPRFGFKPVERTGIPEAVRQSVEFRSACPASALAMEASL